MEKIKKSVVQSLQEAIKSYSKNIEIIITRDPDDTGELACLYAGISGIHECVKALAQNGHIHETELKQLENEIHQLYRLCQP